jgi:hypothetical protein
MSSKEFYGRDYGTNLYVCRPCDAYVGTHKGTNQPLGTPANRDTREWRKLAHTRFDWLWKSGKKSRTKAYLWLQNVMGLTRSEAHIGKFTAEQCKEVVRLVRAREEESQRDRMEGM